MSCSHGYSETARIPWAIESIVIDLLYGAVRWSSSVARVTPETIAFAAEASPSVLPLQLNPPPQLTMSRERDDVRQRHGPQRRRSQVD